MYLAVMKINNLAFMLLIVMDLLLIFGFNLFVEYLADMSHHKRIEFLSKYVRGWKRPSILHLSYKEYIRDDRHLRDAHWLQLDLNKEMSLHGQLSMYRYHRRHYERRMNK